LARRVGYRLSLPFAFYLLPFASVLPTLLKIMGLTSSMELGKLFFVANKKRIHAPIDLLQGLKPWFEGFLRRG